MVYSVSPWSTIVPALCYTVQFSNITLMKSFLNVSLSYSVSSTNKLRSGDCLIGELLLLEGLWHD